ncbi:P-loop containing nucleoside triphosphate hydrolase protein [Coprinopsis sp. MPI-PUGE-AT-0042]|nr:P-loop containing nucleoside triphosphate hydrolase protein [Coprinopsis sp. MPI-PUGE-AT-0042]
MSKNTYNPERKLIVVGDYHAGKTSLLITFAFGYFPSTYVPSTYETSEGVEISFGISDGGTKRSGIELGLRDISGREESERLRPLYYPGAVVIVLCFAIHWGALSVKNVEETWIPEVTHHLPGVPIILVGCKSDLRTDRANLEESWIRDEPPVSSEEGQALAQKIGAKQYLECSAKNGEGVNEVFECAAREAFLYTTQGQKKREGVCVVL